ncbi:sulfatase-like hydrolase/transferase [Agaribacterium sp. ZY112]|uniref:sulfatase-like hydrolase/transferase n=1 Tax=Agaribacterium sp. ZY112 TaxID=3233574 RepID=UPI003523B5CF
MEAEAEVLALQLLLLLSDKVCSAMQIHRPAQALFVLLLFSFSSLSSLALGGLEPEQGSKKLHKTPNILFILSDDAGYADFGFHGSTEIRTPHLDALAKEGTVFKQAYVSAAVCGPSRAGLLTGRYQQRFGYEENNVPGYMSVSGTTGDDMGLPLDQKTIANYLQEQGYRTALFGKWHQGNADRFHPMNRGFDEFYGMRGGARSYFPFSDSNLNHRPEDFLERGIGTYAESPQYFTDALADASIAFIRRNKKQPWFAFVSLTAPHAPMQAMPEDLAKFPKLEGIRKIYAAMMLNMDRNIGRILQTLEDEDLDKNTLVVFTNDNGGPSDQNASNNQPLSGTKANHLEGGIRVPFLMRWPGVTKASTQFDASISLLDLLPTFTAAAGVKQNKLANTDGVDLKPYITKKDKGDPHDYLYWKKEVRAAVRHGDWKLLRFPDRQAELYNIAEDPAELNDLAAAKPDMTAMLYQKLFEWELELERPAWQLKRQYEGAAIKRMDNYWDKK